MPQLTDQGAIDRAASIEEGATEQGAVEQDAAEHSAAECGAVEQDVADRPGTDGAAIDPPVTDPPATVDHERAGTWMTPEEYGASRAAVWTAAVVLVTDTDGRVLVQSVDYRADRLLPGGAVDAGEAPSAAASRELREELGVDGRYPRGLAVDWVPADTPGFPPEMRFPGEILHVYDGGTWTPDRIDAVRLPDQEITGIHFVEPADLPALMDAGDARRALSALRARINGGGTALLEDGRPTTSTALDRLGVLRTRRTPQHGAWHPVRSPRSFPHGTARAGCSPPTAGSCS
ncbi:NUDIX hydrolase [Streptomyces sp. MS1.HAVA.3]|uniref:NUDIX hydrolase n=1 Tax=Streptomyces caledonius TaxID=3134107 RepID=A0ABU8UEW0_9ACTN